MEAISRMSEKFASFTGGTGQDDTASPEQLFGDAVSDFRQGRLPEAEQSLLSIQSRQPDIPDVLHMLALIALKTDRPGEAVKHLEKAVAVQPEVAEYFHLLGAAFKKEDRVEEAIQAYERAVTLDPNHIDAHYNLGNTFKSQDRNQEAVLCYQRAIEINPDFFDAHCNLASVLNKAGQFEESVACCRRAVALRPDVAEAHIILGVAFHHLGQLEDSAASFQQALDIRPDIAEVHALLGRVYRELGRPDDCLASFQRSLEINPGLAEVHRDMGHALLKLGLLDVSISSYQKALALKPRDTEANMGLGCALLELRQFDDAMSYYQKALESNPEDPGVQNIYMHGLLYLPGFPNPELFDTCRKIVAPCNRLEKISPPPDEGAGYPSTLNIGYLSSDFHKHANATLILPLLANHDHQRFNITLYANVTKSDHITDKFREYADQWVSINGMTDAQVAEQIRDDKIHVMVFVGGNFDKNRPRVASYRSAPVQAGLHGGTTSGLEEMDYLITDEILHPVDNTEQTTEELFRLPALFNFASLENAPPVSPLPADENDFITFTSFNKLCKTSNDVLDVWSRILVQLPTARLVLKYWNYLDSPSLCSGILERFEANGIPADRIDLKGETKTQQSHLFQYHRVDIALDPFPYTGGTTNYEAMWMGVPVVSLLGGRYISRMGGSIVAHAGMGMLNAESPDEYVKIAVDLANDRSRLREIRDTLRTTVSNSTLCNGPVFAKNVEEAFVSMWEAHKQSAPDT